MESDSGKPQLHTIFRTVINTAERKLRLLIISRFWQNTGKQPAFNIDSFNNKITANINSKIQMLKFLRGPYTQWQVGIRASAIWKAETGQPEQLPRAMAGLLSTSLVSAGLLCFRKSQETVLNSQHNACTGTPLLRQQDFKY